jgi:ring-1,2-phenylacetyl-CoA epoxidase subunit PaaE
MPDTLRLRVDKITAETAEAKTLTFEVLDHNDFSYQAGQFLTFLFDQHGHEVRRSYSMSSAPGIDTLPAITVKRVANGTVSRLLLQHTHVGDVLQSLKPAGRFTLPAPANSPRDIVMIAAGSGITPLFAMLKSTLRQDPLSHLTLLYSNHSPADTIFRIQLELLLQQYAHQLTIVHLWSNEGKRLNNFGLEQLVRQHLRHLPEQALFYLCGPSDLMRTAHITLKFMGFEEHQIKKEHFVIDPPLVPSIPLLEVPSALTLHFDGHTYHLSVRPGQNVLEAALEQGIRLPYSCRGGRCSACAGKCTSGQVLMSVNDVLTDRDLAQRYILTCTAYPQTEHVEVWVGK